MFFFASRCSQDVSDVSGGFSSKLLHSDARAGLSFIAETFECRNTPQVRTYEYIGTHTRDLCKCVKPKEAQVTTCTGISWKRQKLQ